MLGPQTKSIVKQFIFRVMFSKCPEKKDLTMNESMHFDLLITREKLSPFLISATQGPTFEHMKSDFCQRCSIISLTGDNMDWLFLGRNVLSDPS